MNNRRKAALVVLLVTMVAGVLATPAQARRGRIPHRYDRLIQIMTRELDDRGYYSATFSVHRTKEFYNGFRLLGDGMYYYKNFEGCLSGWPCDPLGEAYETADCTLAYSDQPNQRIGVSQTQQNCTISENYDGKWQVARNVSIITFWDTEVLIQTSVGRTFRPGQ